MWASLMNRFRGPWLSSDLPNREYRRRLLFLSLAVLGLISFVFYVFPFSSELYDPRANLAISIVTWTMMPLALQPRLFFPVIHVASTGIAVFLLYISVHTGGIHSPLNVWFLIFPLPVLLLGGARLALFWLLMASLCIVALFIGSSRGWISYHLAISDTSYAAWAWLNNLCALITLLAIISWYDTMRSRQYLALDMRNDELRNAHTALKQSQAHKEEFMAAVGHELRTPMNAILGLNSVLREQLSNDPERVEVVDHIRRSTRQLLTIVNNVLDFSQLNAGELTLRPSWFDLRELFEEVVDNRKDQASRYGARVTLTFGLLVPVRVYLDRLRLYQMVFNLLENAIRYGQGSPVEVHVDGDQNRLRFEVRDHGPGVDPDLRSTLFQRFEQPLLHDLPHGHGAGLGLSICERLANLQEGAIGLFTPDDGGASFWVELAMNPDQAPADWDVHPSAAAMTEFFRVLLVDDDAVSGTVGQLLLNRHWPNSRVTVLQSARAAIERMQTDTFDLMLVDVHMPDMDGPALARYIRNAGREQWLKLPIIALTGDSSERERKMCLQAGMQDVLVKPMDPQVLARVLQQLKGAHRGH